MRSWRAIWRTLSPGRAQALRKGLMPQSLDPQDLDRLLRRLPLSKAPESLWDRIQASLASGASARPMPLRRPAPRWLVAAAAALAVVTGGDRKSTRLNSSH